MRRQVLKTKNKAADSTLKSDKEGKTAACFLCGDNSQQQITRYGYWKECEKSFLQKHCPSNVENIVFDTILYKKHQIEASRYHSKVGYVPKWKKKEIDKKNLKCMFKNCIVTQKLKHPSFASPNVICSALNIDPRDYETVNLCSLHYSAIYRELHPILPCSYCNAKPHAGSVFNRHSPNASLACNYLNEVHNNDILIKQDDVICYDCYLLHLTIVKYSEKDDKVGSNEELKQQMEELKGQFKNEENDPVKKTIIHTVLHVSSNLLNDRAILLPDASRVFKLFIKLDDNLSDQDITNEASETLYLQLCDRTIKFSSKWLLNKLTLYLHQYMTSKCLHKKYGTLIYRKDGNLLNSLSWALGNCSCSNRADLPSKTQHNVHEFHVAPILEQAGSLINELIHNEIKKKPCSSS